MKSPATDPAVWVEYAKEDLRAAQMALSGNPPLRRIACYHAHQSAEKFLKAILVAGKHTVPKVHDLDYLLTLCGKQDPSLSELKQDCETLNALVEPARYPADDVAVLTADQANEAVAIATRIARKIVLTLKL
jgi:HEPN domain-containing protein